MSDLYRVWRTAVTDISATAQETLGALRYTDNGKIYRYVYNAGATQAANALMKWTDVDAFSCEVNDTANANIAGVTVGAFTTLYYGWVQCGGETGLVVSGAALSVGGSVVASAGNAVTAVPASGTNYALVRNPIGIAQASSSVSSKIYLKGLT